MMTWNIRHPRCAARDDRRIAAQQLFVLTKSEFAHIDALTQLPQFKTPDDQHQQLQPTADWALASSQRSMCQPAVDFCCWLPSAARPCAAAAPWGYQAAQLVQCCQRCAAHSHGQQRTVSRPASYDSIQRPCHVSNRSSSSIRGALQWMPQMLCQQQSLSFLAASVSRPALYELAAFGRN